eukprot:12405755-Karenia_brevis.AAC.1
MMDMQRPHYTWAVNIIRGFAGAVDKEQDKLKLNEADHNTLPDPLCPKTIFDIGYSMSLCIASNSNGGVNVLK